MLLVVHFAQTFTGWHLWVEEQKDSRFLVAKVKAKVKADAESFKSNGSTPNSSMKRSRAGAKTSAGHDALASEAAIINRLISAKKAAAAAPIKIVQQTQSVVGAIAEGNRKTTRKTRRTRIVARVSTIGNSLSKVSLGSALASRFSVAPGRKSGWYRGGPQSKFAVGRDSNQAPTELMPELSTAANGDAARTSRTSRRSEGGSTPASRPGAAISGAVRMGQAAENRAVRRRSLMAAERAAARLEQGLQQARIKPVQSHSADATATPPAVGAPTSDSLEADGSKKAGADHVQARIVDALLRETAAPVKGQGPSPVSV